MVYRQKFQELLDNFPDELTTGELYSQENNLYCALGAMAKNIGMSDEDILKLAESEEEDILKILASEYLVSLNTLHTFISVNDNILYLKTPKERATEMKRFIKEFIGVDGNE